MGWHPGGRVAVIVHTGAITTREAIELTRHAEQIGACAAAIIPPYYYRYGDHALLNHFEQIIAQQPDFPVYLYNNPSVTGYSISKTVINELVKRCPNVVGLKDSSGSLDTLAESLSWHNGSFNSANGCDGLILAGFAIGLDACVSGNANVVPELVVALYNAVAEGDLRTARTLQAKLNRVRAILRDGADLSLFKGVLALRGVPVGAVRSPLLPASEAEITECWQALSALDMPLRPLHPA